MKFPWNKYEELPTQRLNTIQIFITNQCNIKCDGCFARNAMGQDNKEMSIGEYERAVLDFIHKGGQKVNLLGGEPFLHPNLLKFLEINRHYDLRTTIYTNGYYLDKYTKEELKDAKLRVSIYSYKDGKKSTLGIPLADNNFDANFMVSRRTVVEDMLKSAERAEFYYGCEVFFISSLRELDNDRKEFFDDTELTMPLIDYKELVHKFLYLYCGNMEIHISKRGVFESTSACAGNKCRFVNYFIGEKIIQCPYDTINLKFQDDYEFDKRLCQQNNTCLMSKVIYKRK